MVKTKRKNNVDEDIEVVKYAIDHAIQVLAVVSKSTPSDEDIHVRIIGQFDTKENAAWNMLSNIEKEEMYAYASAQCWTDKEQFLEDLAKKVDASIHKNDATAKEYDEYVQKVQAWMDEKASGGTKASCPVLPLDGPTLSSLCNIEIIKALFSRTISATNPSILREEIWGTCAKNFNSRVGQVMLQMWAKENVPVDADIYEKRDALDFKIIEESLSKIHKLNQDHVRKERDYLDEEEYQEVHPADPHDRRPNDWYVFYMPAARDTNVYGFQRRV